MVKKGHYGSECFGLARDRIKVRQMNLFTTFFVQKIFTFFVLLYKGLLELLSQNILGKLFRPVVESWIIYVKFLNVL